MPAFRSASASTPSGSSYVPAVLTAASWYQLLTMFTVNSLQARGGKEGELVSVPLDITWTGNYCTDSLGLDNVGRGVRRCFLWQILLQTNADVRWFL